MERAAALVRDDVDDAAHGVRAVERRAGAAQDFDAARVRHGEVGEEARRVALRRRRVAEAQSVNEQGRVLAPQAARLDRGERAGAAELLHAQARHGSQRTGDCRLVSVFEFAATDDRDGLRDLVNGLRRVRRGDDDLGRDARDFEPHVERCLPAAARDCDLARGAAGEPFGLGLDEVRARREPLEAVRSALVGRRREA